MSLAQTNLQKNVLFVDDEPSILGIYQMLPAFLGDNYQVQTAPGGAEALALMATQYFDVIVSDLMMPQMTGDRFLAEVTRRSPSSARIVVSGFADELTTAKCLMVGHRYFTKPFSPVALTAAIRSLCEAQDSIAEERMRTLVGKFESLPIPSETYLLLTKSLNNQSSSISQISGVVEQDLALAAKVLQTVNSPMFAPRQRITQISHAVQLIGLDVLRALVLSIHVFDLFRNEGLKQFLQQLWGHSLHIALAAKRLAILRRWPTESCEEAFLSGLLHDIGKLVFACNSPAQYQVLHALHANDSQQLCAAESESLGATHAEAGAYLLSLWGLPETIVQAVRMHHSLSASELNGIQLAAPIYLAHQETATMSKRLASHPN
jgi:HD-like signal output (HDOD) protein/CheY-like chemotaxis protein